VLELLLALVHQSRVIDYRSGARGSDFLRPQKKDVVRRLDGTCCRQAPAQFYDDTANLIGPLEIDPVAVILGEHDGDGDRGVVTRLEELG
jgi:hypothetical protein